MSETIDIALALNSAVPGAKYLGSLTDNTVDAFDALVWDDDRAKPTWAEIVAAAASLPGPVQPKPTPREWLERLSAEKQAAISAAAVATPAIFLWLLKAAGSSVIDVSLTETQQGVAALVTAGVLTADDEAALLAP